MQDSRKKINQVVAIYGLVLGLVTMLILASLGRHPSYPLLRMRHFFEAGWLQVLGIILVLVFMVLCWRLLLEARRNEHSGRSLIGQGPMGQIQISKDAIKDIVRKAGKETPGVKGLSIKVKDVGDGVAVLVQVEAEGRSQLVQLGNSLQEKIHRHLETIACVKVKEVRVIVEAVEVNERARARVR